MKTKTISESKIKGDLVFDGKVIFTCNIEIFGKLEVQEVEANFAIHVHKSYTVLGKDMVGGSQKVGEYQKVGGSQ